MLEEWYCGELGVMDLSLMLLLTSPSEADVYGSVVVIPHTWLDPPEMVSKGCVDNSCGTVVCP